MKTALFALLILCGLSGAAIAADSEALADAEMNSWKAYYDRDPLNLYRNVTKMIGLQYHLQDEKTLLIITSKLSYAIMKFGSMPVETEEEDYEKAILPALTSGFTALKEATHGTWNPDEAARLDLAWWIARRKNRCDTTEHTAKIISKLYQTVYGTKGLNSFERAAFLRATAARYHDLCRHEWNAVRESDWSIIRELLKESYLEFNKGAAYSR